MPQMSPMNWLYISFMCYILYLIILMIMNVMPLLVNMNFNSSEKNDYLKWKWFW